MAITAQITLNEILIVEVDSDPSVGGVSAPIGSMALLDDKVNGKLWVKSGAGDTNWSIIPRFANGTAFTAGSIVFADASGFFAQNNAALFWDNSNSRLGLGYNSPQARLHIDFGTAVASAIKFTVGATTGQTSGDGFDIGVDAAGNAELRQRENSSINMFTANTQALSINNAQRVLISSGTTSLASATGEEYRLQIHGLNNTDAGMSMMRYSADNLPPILRFTKSRGATLGAHAAVTLNDIMGTVSFRGSDGSLFGLGASISGYVDAAVAANSIPSRLQFSTTTLAGTTVQERMRIDSSGRVVIGGAAAQDITGLGAFPLFQILGLGAVQMVQIQYSADTIAPVFNSLKSRGATIGTQGLLLQDDELGRFQFRGSDGVNFQAGASMRALVDGTAAAGSMPGRLILMTTPSGATTPVERVRVDSTGLVRVVDALRYNRDIRDFQTQATAATTITLTSANAARQYFTGSVAGQIVRLPDATTLTVGAYYEFVNTSTSTVALQDNAGNLLETMPVVSGLVAAQLLANGTAAGTWSSRSRFEPYYDEVSATATQIITSATDVAVTSMTLTPPAGTYRVMFDSSVTMATAAATFGCVIYVGGTINNNSQRNYTAINVNVGTVTPGRFGITSSNTVTVNGSQAIEVRAKRSAGNATIDVRTLSIIRVG